MGRLKCQMDFYVVVACQAPPASSSSKKKKKKNGGEGRELSSGKFRTDIIIIQYNGHAQVYGSEYNIYI